MSTNDQYKIQVTLDVEDLYGIVNSLRANCGCSDCKRISGDLLAQRRKQTKAESAYHPCGVCRKAKPGAVDWGCVCNRDEAEVLAEMKAWTD